MMEFLNKIGQMLLLSPLALVDLSALLRHDEFWRLGMPVNIDVICSDSTALLERWTLSYEAHAPHASGAAANAAMLPPHSHGPRHHDHAHDPDTTDLILLVQSVYSHVRLLPLGSALADNAILKSDLTYCITLADGRQVAPLSDSGDPVDVPSSGFDVGAKLGVHRFRSARTAAGSLHLSVVYDSAVADPRMPTQQPTGGPMAPATATPAPEAVLSPGCQARTATGRSQPMPPPAHGADPADAATDVADLDPPPDALASAALRSSSGSPFPSPTLQRRALAVANLRLQASDPGASASEPPAHRAPSTPPAGSAARKPAHHTRGASTSSVPASVFARYPAMASTPLFRSSLGRAMVRTASASSEDSDEAADHLWPLAVPVAPSQTPGHAPPLPDLAAPTPSRHPSLQARTSFDLGAVRAALTDPREQHASVAAQVGLGVPAATQEDAHLSRPASRRISMPNMPHASGSMASSWGSRYQSSGTSWRGDASGLSTSASSPTSMRMGTRDSYTATSLDPFGSLVGSYEESILSGRMSTLPSKPIAFVAEIGVIAFGKCKPSLKCPAHLLLAFPAYFYELQDDMSPVTPYVGSIEVDWALSINEANAAAAAGDTSAGAFRSAAEGGSQKLASGDDDPDATAGNLPAGFGRTDSSSSISSRRQKQEVPGYRLPFKGQLQIIIKNPSRTAIKVFLVPYDLRDMPPCTKTFLRQKSYATPPPHSPSRPPSSASQRRMSSSTPTSASPSMRPPTSSAAASQSIRRASGSNPVIPSPLTQHQPVMPPASPTSPQTHQAVYQLQERLRYAIHLQFVCTPKRHLYLTKSIRVVFSPRAPDSDEKLRTVCEGPSKPKYIPMDASTPLSASGAAATAASTSPSPLPLALQAMMPPRPPRPPAAADTAPVPPVRAAEDVAADLSLRAITEIKSPTSRIAAMKQRRKQQLDEMEHRQQQQQQQHQAQQQQQEQQQQQQLEQRLQIQAQRDALGVTPRASAQTGAVWDAGSNLHPASQLVDLSTHPPSRRIARTRTTSGFDAPTADGGDASNASTQGAAESRGPLTLMDLIKLAPPSGADAPYGGWARTARAGGSVSSQGFPHGSGTVLHSGSQPGLLGSGPAVAPSGAVLIASTAAFGLAGDRAAAGSDGALHDGRDDSDVDGHGHSHSACRCAVQPLRAAPDTASVMLARGCGCACGGGDGGGGGDGVADPNQSLDSRPRAHAHGDLMFSSLSRGGSAAALGTSLCSNGEETPARGSDGPPPMPPCMTR
ncbi:hypothetical protein HK105_205678 [Polyrhizophydium stewartii]|uniref:Atos-like conserved domain-containing protein n=1 Tax=Polyrhizophydium stewartii TaxID=2732419 RepID=A0ABR4N5F0_9FUNG